jgi:hypothetical protein
VRPLATAAGALLAALGAGCGTPAPATFTDIYAVMFPLGTHGQCNYCHSVPANEISNGRLGMGETRAEAYAALVGRGSMSARCGGGGARLVVPGDPNASLLYLKLSAAPACGDRMPQGASPLTAAQVEMVRSWIAAGAPND